MTKWSSAGRSEKSLSLVLRGGVASVGMKGANMLIGLATAVLLARSMGANEYGTYAYVYTVVILIAVPTSLGFPQLIVRETARAHVQEQWGLMRGLWRWTTGVVWLVSFVVIGMVGLVLYLRPEVVGGARASVLFYGLGLMPLIALGNIRGAALRGLRKIVVGQMPETILRPGLLLLFATLVLISQGTVAMSAEAAMCLHAVAAAIAFAIGAFLLRKYRPPQVSPGSIPVYRSREWLRATVPLALISSMQLIHHHADLLMLGVYRDSADVGVYKVVVTGASIVVFGLQAVNMVVAPYFARLYTSGDMPRLQKLVTHSSRAILALAVPVVIAFLFFGGQILTIVFGEEYRVGFRALAILACGQLVNAGVGSVGALLNMTGHEHDTMRATALAVVINVVLNLMLIPHFGIDGAAFATTVSLIVWNMLLWRRVRQRLGIDTMAFHLVR